MVYIGIDLGTTYSCVAIIENGRPVAIHNDDGRNTLPSVVAFDDDEILVGNPALDCNTDMTNILYVPAMFHPDQTAATKKAIELAGLKLKYLLQEPTAAAIAYNEKKRLGNSKLLVFDFGGGYDIYKKPKLLKRLRIECRKAKESLSFSNKPINVHLDINDDYEINVKLTKEKLNELCSDLIRKSINYTDRALNMAKLSANNIDNVILVGGSTRIPEVQQKMASKFGKDKLKFDINPDEAVAYGAAIVANAIEV
ncbi:hypothetical protein WR25_27109 [Diploscapter pachys]|uniref:Uncharacterized protein n=1 Tax=Diploscapter pachys TaxID=2018661 RepID=A0A2A2KJ83_9BILA|nr:hypothetical protein WR25_27109 [Diploscapter pachys]